MVSEKYNQGFSLDNNLVRFYIMKSYKTYLFIVR